MKKTTALGFLLTTALSLPGFAQDTAKKPGAATTKGAPSVSAVQRQKMAAMHQKMADCLNSNKSMDECREEMRTLCTGMMDQESCGMGMGMMGGPHRNHMMRQQTGGSSGK